MKFVVWGAGQRGKKALDIWGKDKILFFVDQDERKIGKEIEGIPIKDTGCIKRNSRSYVILITPLEFGNQIADELDKSGIYNYLIFADHPFGIDLSQENNSMEYIQNASKLNGNVVLYGITWFNLYLYDYFNSIGMQVNLFSAGRNHEVLSEIIADEYNIIYNWQKVKEADFVLAPEGIRDLPVEKFIDIEDYIEKTYPVSNYQIEKYRDIHKGRSCFVVATGPSLRVSDLNMLKENGYICISMNRIYNIFDKTDWRPDYYVIEDQKMIEDLAEEIAELELEHKFVNGAPEKYWNLEKSKNSIMYKMIMQNCLNDNIGFSRNLERMIYNGYTVTYVCIQLAVYMGFSEIYLIGVDFNYSTDIYAESNHFEGYQKHYKDIRLNPVMPDKMIRAYKKAKRVTDSMGVHIYNATRGGKLEVFDRIELDEVIERRGKK